MDWLMGSTGPNDPADSVENTSQQNSYYAKSASKESTAPAETDQVTRSGWFSDVGKLFSTDVVGLERAERNTSSPLTPYQELIALCEGDKEEITVTALSTAIEACLNRALADGEIGTVLATCGLDAHTKVLRPSALKALWSASLEAYLVGLSCVGGAVTATLSSQEQSVQGCRVMVDVHRLCALPEAERIKAKSAHNSPEPKVQLSAEPPVLGSGLPSSPLLLTPTAKSPRNDGSSSMSPPKSVSTMLSELSAALPDEAGESHGSDAVVPPNRSLFTEAPPEADPLSDSTVATSPTETPHRSTDSAATDLPSPTSVEMSRTQLIRAKYEENEKAHADAQAVLSGAAVKHPPPRAVSSPAAHAEPRSPAPQATKAICAKFEEQQKAHAQYQSVIAGAAAPGHAILPAKPPAQAFGLRGSHAPDSGALLVAEYEPSTQDEAPQTLPPRTLPSSSPHSGKRLAELEAAIAALSVQSRARAVALEASRNESAQRLSQVQHLEARLADAEQVSLDKSLQLAEKEAEVWRLLRAMADHVTQAPGEDGDADGDLAASVWESERDEDRSGLQALLDATTRDKTDAEARVQALEEEVFELRVTVAKLSHHDAVRPEEAAGHASFVATLAREVSRSRERTRDGSCEDSAGQKEVNEEWFGGAFA